MLAKRLLQSGRWLLTPREGHPPTAPRATSATSRMTPRVEPGIPFAKLGRYR
jgi:hypothetical protein